MSFSRLIFNLPVVGRGEGGGVITLAKGTQIHGRILLGRSARNSAIQILFTFARLVSSSAHVYKSRKLITTIICGNVFDAYITYNNIRIITYGQQLCLHRSSWDTNGDKTKISGR
jgi:hypothetical protein